MIQSYFFQDLIISKLKTCCSILFILEAGSSDGGAHTSYLVPILYVSDASLISILFRMLCMLFYLLFLATWMNFYPSKLFGQYSGRIWELPRTGPMDRGKKPGDWCLSLQTQVFCTVFFRCKFLLKISNSSPYRPENKVHLNLLHAKNVD